MWIQPGSLQFFLQQIFMVRHRGNWQEMKTDKIFAFQEREVYSGMQMNKQTIVSHISSQPTSSLRSRIKCSFPWPHSTYLTEMQMFCVGSQVQSLFSLHYDYLQVLLICLTCSTSLKKSIFLSLTFLSICHST